MRETSLQRFLRTARSSQYRYVIYPIVLLGISAFYLLRWPIVAGDTDLWYHLTSGKYLFEHHAIPPNSFFSFISPPRDWVDYFWGFQALVYQIYTHFDYQGLVVFRAVMYLATVALIYAYLLKGERGRPSRWYFTVLGAMYFIILLSRDTLVRPHLFTYLLTVVFLYVLEFHSTRAFILLPLSLLWCNVHGLTYPVMLLISSAYVLEYFVRRLQRPTSKPQHIHSFLIPTTLSMTAIYLTPHGYRLPALTFTSISYASQFIQEFQHLPLAALTSVAISQLAPSVQTIFNLVLLAACLALCTAFLKRQIRPSHLLMFLGGLFLVTKGVRFMNECSLLALPLLKANPLTIAKPAGKRTTAPATIALAGLLLVMPIRFISSFLHAPSRYPFSHDRLPVGVATFLRYLNVGGFVLNDPNTGGYLQWMLYPRYKIFMDMEIPLLFTDEDFHMAGQMFVDERVLKTILDRYDPSFITVSNQSSRFKTVIQKFPDYVLVFFDDREVLYLNRRHHPELAEAYELKEVDPFRLLRVNWEERSIKDEKGAWLTHLSTLLSINPDSGVFQEMVARIALENQQYDQAISHANVLIRNFPQLPVGYVLRGDAFTGLRLFDQAATAYVVALKKSGSDPPPRLYRRLGATYVEQQQYRKAYEALRHSFDVFSSDTSFEDLYHFGAIARLAGKRKEAAAAFSYLYYYRLAKDDTAWREKVEKELVDLGVDLSQP